MSANNQLIITTISKEWCVFMDCCVDNDFNIPSKEKALFKTKSLKKAIDFCNNYCSKEIVEYGYRVM